MLDEIIRCHSGQCPQRRPVPAHPASRPVCDCPAPRSSGQSLTGQPAPPPGQLRLPGQYSHRPPPQWPAWRRRAAASLRLRSRPASRRGRQAGRRSILVSCSHQSLCRVTSAALARAGVRAARALVSSRRRLWPPCRRRREVCCRQALARSPAAPAGAHSRRAAVGSTAMAVRRRGQSRGSQ